jgi:hypothetical protein
MKITRTQNLIAAALVGALAALADFGRVLEPLASTHGAQKGRLAAENA